MPTLSAPSSPASFWWRTSCLALALISASLPVQAAGKAAPKAPRSAGLSPTPIAPSKKPVYRPYLAGTQAIDFHCTARSAKALTQALATRAWYFAGQGRAIEGAVREEVGRLLQQAGVDNQALLHLPAGPELGERLAKAYQGKVAPELLWYACMRGTLQGLGDPQARLLTPHEQTARNGRLAGGAGLTLVAEASGTLRVREVIDQTPAARGGVEPGDVLVGINEDACTGWLPSDASAFIRGPVNSPLVLRLHRQANQTPYNVHLMRALVAPPPLSCRTLDDGVHYLHLRELQPAALSIVREELAASTLQAPARVVLDLRSVESHDTSTALELVSLFTHDGKARATLDGPRQQQVPLRAESDHLPVAALTVLVDAQTSGTTELAAALLHELAHAQLVGQRTAGKGTHVSYLALADGSYAWFSSGRFRTPAGVTFDRQGVKPDLRVDRIAFPPGGPKDEALATARRLLAATRSRIKAPTRP